MLRDDPLIRATLAGARSMNILGWQGEECESAALERLVANPCLTTAVAYRQGKRAAQDELRKLTGNRRLYPLRTVPLDTNDAPCGELEDMVASDVDIERWIQRLSHRHQIIIRLVLRGDRYVEVARALGVHESAITHLLRGMPRYEVLKAVS